MSIQSLSVKGLTNTLPKNLKTIAKGVELYEDEKQFANVRFIQDTIVNWGPKALLSRGLVDFADMSFLEFSENILVYYGGKFFKENVFKKLLLRKASTEIKNKIETPAVDLLKDKNSETTKKLMPLKAALAVCGLIIPIAEYSLSYVKNIFTMKIFNQSDFNNIANLNKNKKEDVNQQQKVRKSAINHIKLAGGIFAGCLGFATLLATKGKNSKALQSFSEAILAPGNKIFKPKSSDKKAIEQAAKKAASFNKYFSLDSSRLCRGQLVACVVAGFFGYMGAAKDRGKQNMLEVLFRYPIVTFYVITGSEMFEAAYKKILKKNGKCKELLGEEEMPSLKELPQLAQKYAQKNGTTVEAEFKKLLKQKATIIGIPLTFSLVVMGLFVAGMSRFFTQYRYNQDLKKQRSGFSFGQKDVVMFKNKYSI